MPRSGAGTYRVLVVDDDDAVRRLTVVALRRVGLECHSASNGAEALQRMQVYHYDAIVTDMRMPRRHGHALCVEALSLPSPPLVFVLTGVDEPRLLEDLKARGVAEIFLKPVDYTWFARRIFQALENRRLTQLRQASRAAALNLDERKLSRPDRDVKLQLLMLLGLADPGAKSAISEASESTDPNWLL